MGLQDSLPSKPSRTTLRSDSIREMDVVNCCKSVSNFLESSMVQAVSLLKCGKGLQRSMNVPMCLSRAPAT